MYTVGGLFTGTVEDVTYTDVRIYAVATYADGSYGLVLTPSTGMVYVRVPAPPVAVAA